MLKNPKPPDGFGGKVFIGRVWGESCKVYDFLLFSFWYLFIWLHWVLVVAYGMDLHCGTWISLVVVCRL